MRLILVPVLAGILAMAAACQQVGQGGGPVYNRPSPGYGGLPYPDGRTERDFVRVCRNEAAGRYRVSGRAIRFDRVEPGRDRYRLSGEVDLDRQVALIDCFFGPRGGFDGLRERDRYAAGGGGRPDRPGVDRAAMQRYCRDEAAQRYRASPREVSMGRVASAGQNYRVEGKVSGRDYTARFQCSFGPRGGFDRMVELERVARPGGGGGRPGAGGQPDFAQMQRFCRDEAARRFRVRANQVDVGRVLPMGDRYAVDGRLSRQVGGATFRCRFGRRGGFDGMAETS